MAARRTEEKTPNAVPSHHTKPVYGLLKDGAGSGNVTTTSRPAKMVKIGQIRVFEGPGGPQTA